MPKDFSNLQPQQFPPPTPPLLRMPHAVSLSPAPQNRSTTSSQVAPGRSRWINHPCSIGSSSNTQLIDHIYIYKLDIKAYNLTICSDVFFAVLKMWPFWKVPWWLQTKEVFSKFTLRITWKFQHSSKPHLFFFGHLNSPPNKAQKKDPQAAPPSIVELKVAKHYLNAWSPLDVWRHVADFDFIFTCIYIYIMYRSI